MTQGAGRTVAIIGAYDAVHAESDLAAYRTNYGLAACISTSGCFGKINQNGATSPLPAQSPANDDWDAQDAVEFDMVSAVCPACNILLVEADDDQGDGLYIAVNTAAAQPGVVAIIVPFGGPEYSGEQNDDDAYFHHPGLAIVVPGGDEGYHTAFPAASQYVVAVGGTSLQTAANSRGWTETVWHESNTEGTGSGCSTYIAKPAFQKDSGCTNRTSNDIPALADPNTGIAVYDQRDGGWFIAGGTSAATGIIAGVFALAGPSKFPGLPASYLYRDAARLNDVTSGTNGSCSGSYLCTAEVGYDGPTGNGTPNGTAAFIDDTIFAGGFETE